MPKDIFARRKELQEQGLDETSINNQLMTEGYNPSEINNMLSQEKTQQDFQ